MQIADSFNHLDVPDRASLDRFSLAHQRRVFDRIIDAPTPAQFVADPDEEAHCWQAVNNGDGCDPMTGA